MIPVGSRKDVLADLKLTAYTERNKRGKGKKKIECSMQRQASFCNVNSFDLQKSSGHLQYHKKQTD
jgi:hypothetical protein